MIAGGVEAAIHEAAIGGFCSMKALSTRNDDPPAASRPFDRDRDGFVIGEGAGALILEALEHAEARGVDAARRDRRATGRRADASHITLPAPGGIGAVRAARRALEKAGLEPSAIDHVNAHATSTPEGDRAELQAIRTVFGAHAATVAVTANKSMLGHTLGAAGAIEAIATIQAIRTGVVPPTINLDDAGRGGRRARPDPEPGDPAGGPDGDVELVRVRRPEHRPRLHEVRAMTDDRGPGQATARPARRARPRPDPTRDAGEAAAGGSRERRSWMAPTARCSRVLDRLTGLLERSDLTELEVEAGGTGLVLRKASALPAPAQAAAGGSAQSGSDSAAPPADRPLIRPSVKAPLTGIFYAAPGPGSAPYVQAGGEVAIGQVIGLIEAMKLFNEIKSDLAGRVVRVVAESGQLVKAKQPLIEVEPL